MTILARLVGTALIVVALRDIFQQLLPPERGRLTELDAHAECLARIPLRCGRSPGITHARWACLGESKLVTTTTRVSGESSRSFAREPVSPMPHASRSTTNTQACAA